MIEDVLSIVRSGKSEPLGHELYREAWEHRIPSPSPPVNRLLAEYLPLIPTRNTVGGEVLPPPPHLIEKIRNGAAKRNTVAHIGATTATHEEVQEVLLAVRDVLWLLDYYSGQTCLRQHTSRGS